MKPSNYPTEYLDLFRSALVAPVEIECESEASAKALRVELYRYRFAVRDQLPATRPLYDELVAVELSVVEKVLILRRKKQGYLEIIKNAIP